jgi:hypothetical protein
MKWCATLGLWLAVMLAGPAHAADGKGFMSSLHYAIGVSLHAGIGSSGSRDEPIVPILEGAAFEFRSYFSPRVSSHTTLNLMRTTLAGVLQGHARLDYDLHVGFSFPNGTSVEPVIAPGAAIGYTFDKSPDSRFAGDIRMGFDTGKPGGRFSWGLYVRPFLGWRVVSAPELPSGKRGGLHSGVLVELVFLHHTKPRP